MSLLGRGSPHWFSAAGEAALALGRQGRFQELGEIARELEASARLAPSPAVLGALARTSDQLLFAGEHREALDPGTLESDGGRLYCRVREGAFRAGFGRVALQQMAPFLVEGESGPALELGDRRHPIRPAGAGDAAARLPR